LIPVEGNALAVDVCFSGLRDPFGLDDLLCLPLSAIEDEPTEFGKVTRPQPQTAKTFRIAVPEPKPNPFNILDAKRLEQSLLG
jgi:hypothetical protein